MPPRAPLALAIALTCSVPGLPSGAAGQEKDPPEVRDLEKAARAGEHGKAMELGRLGKDALPALVRLLKDASLPDPARYMAANGLGDSGLPAAVPALRNALDDASFNVRRCAAEALGRLNAKEAVPRLTALAREDPFVWQDPQSGQRRWLVRESAVKALRALGEKVPDLPAEKVVPWQQPAMTTGTPFSDTIPWERTLEAALARAAREQKPVLATLVAIGDARWSSGWEGAAALLQNIGPHPFGDDRAQQIDEGLVKERALMATLFTDPDVVDLVRSRFVPVRLRVHTYDFDAATAQPATDPLRKLGTTGVACPPPAVLFAAADGKLIHACRSMGTLHVPMLRAMLRSVLERTGAKRAPERPVAPSPALDGAWAAWQQGLREKAWELLAGVPPRERDFEASFLRGLVAAGLGKHEEARAAFAAARAGDPKGPWGSRAAICLKPSGIALPEWDSLVVQSFEPLAASTERSVPAARLPAVLTDAVTFLLRHQRADGLWGNAFVDPHPMAGPGSAYDLSLPRTGLVVDALIKVTPRVPALRKEIDLAVERGSDAVGKFADAPEGHVWHLTYALHLQLELLRERRGDLAAARRRAANLVAALGKEQKSGGWSYMPPPRIHSFNTAPVLLLLAELKRFEVPVPENLINGAVALLEDLRSREDPREFRYATSVDHRSVKASSCRSALCELALLEATKGESPDRLRAAVELFFAHEPEVRGTRKIFESYFAVGPLHDAYHYYFGHYYTARALARLPAEDARRFALQQRDVILAQVELDGSFVDAQMQGKSYSTAMAVLTLLEDLKHLEK